MSEFIKKFYSEFTLSAILIAAFFMILMYGVADFHFGMNIISQSATVADWINGDAGYPQNIIFTLMFLFIVVLLVVAVPRFTDVGNAPTVGTIVLLCSFVAVAAIESYGNATYTKDGYLVLDDRQVEKRFGSMSRTELKALFRKGEHQKAYEMADSLYTKTGDTKWLNARSEAAGSIIARNPSLFGDSEYRDSLNYTRVMDVEAKTYLYYLFLKDSSPEIRSTHCANNPWGLIRSNVANTMRADRMIETLCKDKRGMALADF